ncbi:MAG: hypothetical protein ABL962_20835 [Fimbriimonadaceae bacterium]
MKTAAFLAGTMIVLAGCSKLDSATPDKGGPPPSSNPVFHFVDDEPWEFNFFSNSGPKLGFGVLVDGARFKRGNLTDGKIGSGDATTRYHDMPLSEALKMFMQENPGYEWKEFHGIVNIVPTKPDSVPMQLLAKRVKSFSADEQGLMVAVRKLFKQEGLPLGYGMSINCLGADPNPPRIKYYCRNASILECLDLFVVQRGGYHWQFGYDYEKKSFIAGDGCLSIEGGFW